MNALTQEWIEKANLYVNKTDETEPKNNYTG